MLKLENVSKRLGDFAINNINLQVDRGQYFVILGPSGTGKTVLLEIIAGFHRPDQGRVYLYDKDITRLPAEARKMGFVYQDYMLFPHMTVKDNILFGARKCFPLSQAMDKMKRLVDLLGIGHLLDRYPLTLSGGEQQRVALARVLIIEPTILLLDEPLSSLDPNSQEALQLELKRIHEEFETTILHITHDFNEAINLATHVGVMINGTLAQTGTAHEVFSHPNSLEVATFLGIENIIPGRYMDGTFKCNEQLVFPAPPANGQSFSYIYFSSKDVRLGSEPGSGNCFQGIVTGISLQKDFVSLSVDVGHQIRIKLSHREFNDYSISCGNKIEFHVPVSSLGFF